jgi:hypothetical protein
VEIYLHSLISLHGVIIKRRIRLHGVGLWSAQGQFYFTLQTVLVSEYSDINWEGGTSHECGSTKRRNSQKRLQ